MAQVAKAQDIEKVAPMDINWGEVTLDPGTGGTAGDVVKTLERMKEIAEFGEKTLRGIPEGGGRERQYWNTTAASFALYTAVVKECAPSWTEDTKMTGDTASMAIGFAMKQTKASYGREAVCNYYFNRIGDSARSGNEQPYAIFMGGLPVAETTMVVEVPVIVEGEGGSRETRIVEFSVEEGKVIDPEWFRMVRATDIEAHRVGASAKRRREALKRQTDSQENLKAEMLKFIMKRKSG